MTINNKLFRNPLIYTEDMGLTDTKQDTPITEVETDSSWMKAGLIEGDKKGRIVNAADYQKFVPYQAGYESNKTNTWGIVKQSDAQHPWVDYTENTWQDTINHPADFRGNFDIEGWYAAKLNTPKELYQWKTDIFGNQYGLYKDFGTPDNPISYYNKKIAYGDFWINGAQGTTETANIALTGIYNNYASINTTAYNELTSNQIREIDVFYDTLMIITKSFILLNKIQMNYTSGDISSIIDYSHIIELENNFGGKFADTWFFEDTKKVIFCNVKFINNIPIPYLYELDLDKNTFFQKFPNANSELADLNELAVSDFHEIDYPQFTYNNLTQTFNIALQATHYITEDPNPDPNISWTWDALKRYSGSNTKTWRQLKADGSINLAHRWFETTLILDSTLVNKTPASLILINISNQSVDYKLTNVILINPVDLSNS